MTKYSKIKKSSFAILALSLILVAVLAFGGTYAYFNATANETGTVSTGTLTLTDTTKDAGITAIATFVPNEEAVASLSSIKFEGTAISALRIKLEVTELTDDTNVAGAKVSLDEVKSVITIAVAAHDGATGTWSQNKSGEALVNTGDASYYYSEVVGGPESAAITLDSLADVSVKMLATAGNKFQGIAFSYTVTVEAAQAEWNETIDADGTKFASNKTITAAEAAQLDWNIV